MVLANDESERMVHDWLGLMKGVLKELDSEGRVFLILELFFCSIARGFLKETAVFSEC